VNVYSALRETLDEAGRKALRQEANTFVDQVLAACGIPSSGTLEGRASSVLIGCITDQYNAQRALLVRRLPGDALEESYLSPSEAVEIQKKLKAGGLLPDSAAIDGVLGPATREGIVKWQILADVKVTGFASHEMLAAPAQASTGKMQPTPTATIPAPPAPSSATNVGETIKKETRLNDRCRDGPGDDAATQRACDQRDALIGELKNAGWCWGHSGQIEAEKEWQRCEISTDRLIAVANKMMELVPKRDGYVSDWRTVEADGGTVYLVDVSSIMRNNAGAVEIIVFVADGRQTYLPSDLKSYFFDCHGNYRIIPHRAIFTASPRSVASAIEKLACTGGR
jgi:hypothetical protein